MGPATARLVAVLTIAVLFSCSGSTPTPAPEQLARDQTLRLPIYAAPRPGDTSLDPGFLSTPLATSIGDNLFDGLYRYNDQMKEQPDIAQAEPTVSTDGLIYTFHIRHDVRFWNGDPVTASDVAYSWNRAAALQANWATVFQSVAGYDAVAKAGKVTDGASLHLSTPDPYTLIAQMAVPSGYWLAELALPAAWVVDKKAIERDPTQWWTTPNGLIGTGPFRMTDWTSSGELDFTSVSNWWNGSTGALTRVELHTVTPTEAWDGYATSQYDVLGFGLPDNTVSDVQNIASLRHDPARSSQVHTFPFGTTSWVAFNLQAGPFSGSDSGRQLRQAFSQAIDRNKLAQALCQDATICVPATGGVIAKGLLGYLGDGADPGAKFDPVAAKATVKRLDPDGKLLQGLTFYYPVQGFDPNRQAYAANLAAQWSANLGVTVTVKALDRDTFFTDQGYGRFVLWRLGWEADYDHPQDWFDNLFINNVGCGQPICTNLGTPYNKPEFTSLITSADKKPLSEALPDYVKAGRMLADDYAYAALYYLVRTVVIKPYVQGYAANALWENRWASLRILQH